MVMICYQEVQADPSSRMWRILSNIGGVSVAYKVHCIFVLFNIVLNFASFTHLDFLFSLWQGLDLWSDEIHGKPPST